MTHASPTPHAADRNLLSAYTTLRLGGPARELVETRDWSEAVNALREADG
ncbi:MAG: hypothetical protein HOQ43_08690, partial [Glycomyces artemisiae]|nr:hypothetical protein [Glycomyces artemisiae]